MEQVMAWNAALANANLGVANNVIAAQQAAPALVTVDQANKVLTAQSMIADGDRQLTLVLQTLGKCASIVPQPAIPCTANAQQVNALVAQIEASSNELVAHDIGIKDAATSKAVLSAMNSIFTLAQQIVGALQTGGMLQ